MASAQPTLAVVVVLPTPPLPDVMTNALPFNRSCLARSRPFDRNLAFPDARDLRRRVFLSLLVRRCDRDATRDTQLHRLEPQRVDGGRFVALCSRVCDAAQRAPYHDIAGCRQFGAGIDVANDDDRTEGA